MAGETPRRRTVVPVPVPAGPPPAVVWVPRIGRPRPALLAPVRRGLAARVLAGSGGGLAHVAAGVHVDANTFGAGGSPYSGSNGEALSGLSPYGTGATVGWQHQFNQAQLPWIMVICTTSAIATAAANAESICGGSVYSYPADFGYQLGGGRPQPKIVWSWPCGFGDVTCAQVASGGTFINGILGRFTTAVNRTSAPDNVVRIGWEWDGFLGGANAPANFWTTSPLHYTGSSSTPLADAQAAFTYTQQYLAANLTVPFKIELNGWTGSQSSSPPYTMAQIASGLTFDICGADNYFNFNEANASRMITDLNACESYAATNGKSLSFSELGERMPNGDTEWANAPTCCSGLISHLDSLSTLHDYCWFQGFPGDGNVYDFGSYPLSEATWKARWAQP